MDTEGLIRFAISGGLLTFLLNRWAARSQLRFEHLHKRRVEHIEECYRLLTDCETVLARATDVQIGPDEALAFLREFGLKANALREFMQPRRIWLSKKACDRFDKYWESLKTAGYVVGDWRSRNPTKDWNDVMQATKRDLPAIKRQIEKQFRQLLGV